MKRYRRQETNKDDKDVRELITHIKFGADAALERKMQVIDGCCIIKVLLFLTEYCTLSQLLKY